MKLLDSAPKPITHHYQLGPSSVCGKIARCNVCNEPCVTIVLKLIDAKYQLIGECLCWFCFAEKYAQTGNAVKGTYVQPTRSFMG